MATVKFLADNVEDGDYNQYWYSEKTIDKIVEALIANGGRIAFLSTPSLYFSLPDEIRSKSFVFDVSKEYLHSFSLNFTLHSTFNSAKLSIA